MSNDEAIQRIKAAGFGGYALWHVGDQYMACLLSRNAPETEPNTNLWSYTDTAEEAVTKIVEKAERLAANR